MYEQLLKKIDKKQARVGILGMGYVGLPLAEVFCSAGFKTVGFDIDPEKVAKLNAEKELEAFKESGRNRRFGQGEAGKNSRNAANLNERKRATSLRYGDEGDKPVSQLDQQINKVSDLNAAKKAKKQAAPPAN